MLKQWYTDKLKVPTSTSYISKTFSIEPRRYIVLNCKKKDAPLLILLKFGKYGLFVHVVKFKTKD